MHVTPESASAVQQRLPRVLGEAEFCLLPGTWLFHEFDSNHFTEFADPNALALVRDDQSWSQLVPAAEGSAYAMLVWSFHFKHGVDNSGFVGWLASMIKARTGSGVAVVCGQNSQRGGIFDYWCCPLEAEPEVVALLQELRALGQERSA